MAKEVWSIGRPEALDTNELIEEEVCLPSQLDNTPEWTGTKKICLAILQDAMSILRRGVPTDPRHKRIYQETLEWTFTEHDPENVFSFETVCEAVGFDPGRVRQLVLQGRLFRKHRVIWGVRKKSQEPVC